MNKKQNRFSFIMRSLGFMLLGIFCASAAFAQHKVEMADTMRSNGKIYVVVAVCLTIMLGLFLYVFLIDRKLTRLEQKGE